MTDLIARALGLGVGVGQISDAMDELGLPQNAGGGYRLLGGDGGTVIGRAFTVRQQRLESGQAGAVRQGEAALSLAKPGDILVIDAGGSLDVVTWGEGHSLRALINRLAGVILHGVTRDAGALQNGPLPTLCRGTAPLRSKGRLHTVAVNEAVNLDGVAVRGGDLVAMDADGMVCIPCEHEAEVLTKACAIQTAEADRDAGFLSQLTAA